MMRDVWRLQPMKTCDLEVLPTDTSPQFFLQDSRQRRPELLSGINFAARSLRLCRRRPRLPQTDENWRRLDVFYHSWVQKFFKKHFYGLL